MNEVPPEVTCISTGINSLSEEDPSNNNTEFDVGGDEDDDDYIFQIMKINFTNRINLEKTILVQMNRLRIKIRREESRDSLMKDLLRMTKIGKGSRIIVVHAGNEAGFVKDALLVFVKNLLKIIRRKWTATDF